MAGSVQKSLSNQEFILLRSIFFKQGLPQQVYLKPSSVILVSQRLERAGYIRYRNGQYIVTVSGVARLHELGQRPRIAMIDLPDNMLLDQSDHVMQYRITSSLAQQLVERVSSGEI